ncbi:unnamed protein product, partial [Amoebophrya sp. A25]
SKCVIFIQVDFKTERIRFVQAPKSLWGLRVLTSEKVERIFHALGAAVKWKKRPARPTRAKRTTASTSSGSATVNTTNQSLIQIIANLEQFAFGG